MGRCEGEHLGVGIGRGARRVAWVTEEVGGPPQELDAGPGHVAGDEVDDRVEIGLRRGECRALGCDVPVVEAEEGNAKLGKEFERRIDLRPGREHRVEARIEPWPVERPDAEDVGTGPVERMPEAHRDPKVILHPLPEDEAIGLIHLE